MQLFAQWARTYLQTQRRILTLALLMLNFKQIQPRTIN